MVWFGAVNDCTRKYCNVCVSWSSLLCEFQLIADDKQKFHELLTQLPGPINEAVEIAGELAKKLRKSESSTSKVHVSNISALVLYSFVCELGNAFNVSTPLFEHLVVMLQRLPWRHSRDHFLTHACKSWKWSLKTLCVCVVCVCVLSFVPEMTYYVSNDLLCAKWDIK